VDLDSVDNKGTLPKEQEELSGEEDQSIHVRPVMLFDNFDPTLLSDSVMVEQINALIRRSPVPASIQEEDSHPAISSAWPRIRKQNNKCCLLFRFQSHLIERRSHSDRNSDTHVNLAVTCEVSRTQNI
jgi:hypothetical protein